MDNVVPLKFDRFSYLNDAETFHDVAAIGGRFYSDVREAELEPVYGMLLALNNITLRGGLESLLGGIIDVRNIDGNVVSGIGGDNQTECRL